MQYTYKILCDMIYPYAMPKIFKHVLDCNVLTRLLSFYSEADFFILCGVVFKMYRRQRGKKITQ